ncbi:MAG TPA: endonuclease/exonuclease/phosphatase family protein [Allosphingosinicella sp.]|nr:endonuclease/exonuclease/phosphatase family protein [Allosphingosinicella sp.]
MLLLKMLTFNRNFVEQARLENEASRAPKGFTAILAGAVALGGCTTFPSDRMGKCGGVPAIGTLADGSREMRLSVLTYNVEGLPWPARQNRGPRLLEITRQLAAKRASGTAPDIVLIQEAFTNTAVRIGERAGYANYVRGPGAGMRRPPTSEEAEPELVERRKRGKGEGFPQFMPSGLYILSDFAIMQATRQPFRSRECAGFDCLSNKGLLHARVAVPGLPQPVDLFNTHLNSRGSTGVSEHRSLLAHRLQVEETGRFIETHRDPANPLIFGGDFNMRNAPDRYERFAMTKPWPIVHEWCLRPSAGCDVRLSWDGDTPWMDTQDLQGFDSGTRVTVRPERVEAMFDAPWKGRPLADHDGFLVVYRLSWQPAPEEPDMVQSRCSARLSKRLAGVSTSGANS